MTSTPEQLAQKKALHQAQKKLVAASLVTRPEAAPPKPPVRL